MREFVKASGLDDNPVAVEVVRGGILECVHRARVAITAPGVTPLATLGAAEVLMYPRSSLKPLQAVAMLRMGCDLDGRLLALAGATHSGEPFHRAGVREILHGCGLDEQTLQNTPDLPLGEDARDAWLASGRRAEPIAQNCSGKHAAMLRTCVRAGLEMASYRDPEHPLQQQVAATIAELTGHAALPTIDGCGAPLFATTLTGLAAAFGHLAAAQEGAERQVADAFRSHPEYASGTGRLDLALHQRVPGLVCKVGAEGCMAVGLSDGTGIAVKIDDGATRAVGPLVAAILTRLGFTGLGDQLTTPVLGHGEPVGLVRVRQSSLEELFAPTR